MSPSYVSRVSGPRTEGVALGSCPLGLAPDFAQVHRTTTQLPGKTACHGCPSYPANSYPAKMSETDTCPGGPRGRW